jgi:glycosyltransferase involved in cell wall biosynthesis
MIISEAHSRHPIVRRQVPTLLKAGAQLIVVEGVRSQTRIAGLQYTVVYVPPISLNRPARQIWRVLRLFAPWSGEIWWTFVHIMQLLLTSICVAGTVARIQADFYQAHDLYSLLPTLIVGKLKHTTTIYDAHELTSEQGNPRSLRNRFERALEGQLVPRVDKLVMPTTARAQHYVQRFSLQVQPTVVMNCPPTRTVQRTPRLRERLGLPASTRVALYHGTFIQGRALEQLMMAARSFEPNTVLVMIGEQNDFFRAVLRPMYEQQDLAGRVYFFPYVEPQDLLEYVAAADVGIVIYRMVNLNNILAAPTKLYDYLMAGVPVAVAAVPDMKAFLQEFDVGRAFDPEQPSSIAAAINSVLSATDSDCSRREEELLRARRTFNWENESTKLLSVFGLSAANPNPGQPGPDRAHIVT